MSAQDNGRLEPIEKASIGELRALQLQRMKWAIRHVYDNVPHYRKKYDAAGVHPDDLKQLSDLAKFPFTTKADLRDTYPFGMFATPMRDVVRVHASSGTTGKPTVVGYTRDDIAMWAQMMARSMRAAGCTADDMILNSLQVHHGMMGPAVVSEFAVNFVSKQE